MSRSVSCVSHPLLRPVSRMYRQKNKTIRFPPFLAQLDLFQGLLGPVAAFDDVFFSRTSNLLGAWLPLLGAVGLFQDPSLACLVGMLLFVKLDFLVELRICLLCAVAFYW